MHHRQFDPSLWIAIAVLAVAAGASFYISHTYKVHILFVFLPIGGVVWMAFHVWEKRLLKELSVAETELLVKEVLRPDGTKELIWPPLPENQFLAGRIATEEDVQVGFAIFSMNRDKDQSQTAPMEIALPQYGLLRGTDTDPLTPVIVVQAEKNLELELVGYLDLETGDTGISTLEDIELLGKSPKQ